MNKPILVVCIAVMMLFGVLLLWQNQQLKTQVRLLEKNQRELTQQLQDLDDRLVQLNQQFLNHFYGNTIINQGEPEQPVDTAHTTQLLPD